ncbi:MAG TPA: heme-copper oxidase subunit III [Flavisolibacter sp.]|jgi:cytochrome c oxidase subunit III|nr:heme-copper oxidase subunit III [Flavisolibacter sp.]
MDIVSTQQQNKIHPHKFALWVAIAAIIMMFAGLTSAYIVKSGAPGWEEVRTPKVFWYSTAVLLISSFTIQASLRAFKQRAMQQFRTLFLITTILGVAFVILQWEGFKYLWSHGVRFEGAGAGQFLYIIFGLHALHVLGGVVALIVIAVQQFFGRTRNYNATSIEVMSTYWHFVDVLWLYLLIFFIWIG